MLRLRAFGLSRNDASAYAARHAQDWRRQALWGVSVGLLCALGTLLLLTFHPLGQSLEHECLDFWFSLRGPSSASLQSSGQVAILAVDAPTVRRWGGRVFDASDIGKLLQMLKSHGVVAAGLAWRGLADGSLRPDEASSAALAVDLGNSGIAYLPLGLGDEAATAAQTSPTDLATPGQLLHFAIAGTTRPGQSEDDSFTAPAPPAAWLEAAAGAGGLATVLDSDGQVRRVPLVLPGGDHLYPSLALAMALGLAQSDKSAPAGSVALSDALGRPSGLRHAHTLSFGQSTVPLLRPGLALLDFPYLAGSEADADTSASAPFEYFSVAAVLDNPGILDGMHSRCVLIGPTAPSVTGLLSTPTGRRISETELQAVALDNLLSGHTIESVPGLWIWLLTLALCAVTGGFAATRAPLFGGVVVLLCLSAAATISLGLFEQEIWLDISAPWLGTAITFLCCLVWRARRQEREATRIGSTIEALTQVGDIISSQRESDRSVERILQWTQTALRAQSSSLLLLDETERYLRFVAANGPRADGLLPYTVALGRGIAGWVAQNGQAAIVNDLKKDERFAAINAGADSPESGATAVLCVPMRANDKLVGVLEVFNRTDGTAFNEDDAELLGAIANQSALVLENARLYDMLSERVEQSESDLAATNQRLQAEKNTLQTVLRSMTDGVIVCDRDSTVRLVNPAAARLLELQAVQPGCTLRELLPELAEAAPGAQLCNLELRRTDIETPRAIEARRATLQNAEGAPIGSLWVLADVTARRGIEQAKSDFVSFVAHEMRSPLTSISGFSSILQRQELQESQPPAEAPAVPAPRGVVVPPPPRPADSATRARFLGIIHNESERLTRLINNLLDVARIEAGRGIELNRAPFAVGELVAEVAALQRGYSSRHRILCEVQRGLPPLVGDRDKVAQIIINLVSNALKYSPGGTVTITARATTTAGAASARDAQDGLATDIEFAVRDEGPGIAPDQQPHLFERFGRLASEAVPTKAGGVGGQAKPAGTGLGLFLTRHLVEAHGGRIWYDGQGAETAKGRGSTFRFTVPLR